MVESAETHELRDAEMKPSPQTMAGVHKLQERAQLNAMLSEGWNSNVLRCRVMFRSVSARLSFHSFHLSVGTHLFVTGDER